MLESLLVTTLGPKVWDVGDRFDKSHQQNSLTKITVSYSLMCFESNILECFRCSKDVNPDLFHLCHCQLVELHVR